LQKWGGKKKKERKMDFTVLRNDGEEKPMNRLAQNEFRDFLSL